MLDGFKGILFGFKHPCRTDKHLFLGGHARNFDNSPIGADIALKANHAAGLGQRSFNRINHPPIRLARDRVQFLAQCAARHGHTILVQQARLAQFLEYDRHAARLEHILGDIGAAGAQRHEIGRVAEDVADIEQVKRNPGFVGNGRQMQARIGRPAGRSHHAGGIFQRLAGDDIPRPDVLFDQVHHGHTRRIAILVTGFVRGRGAGGIQQRQTNRLGHASHGIGSVLPAAGPGAGAGDPFQNIQFGIRHQTRLMLAHRLEHILHHHILAVQPAWQDRAAIDKHRRHIQPDHRHHHAGQGFVAARQTDQRIIAVPAHGQFNRVGDGIAGGQTAAHPLMPHRHAVSDGDRGKFARGAATLFHPHLDRLGLAAKRDIAGRCLVPAGRNPNPGLMNLFLGDPHRIEKAAMRRAGGPFGHMAAG